jgi:glycosyltransferase involved in cell wall biosynthesis
VIFSGKTEDYRNPSYFPSILDFIDKNNLQSFIKILGLIPRENQLSLLKNSLAVIQPSKFEGWSTIIEDSKTLSHQIICSKLPVHIEQLGNNGFYFEPDSVDELASIMKSFLDGSVKEKIIKYSYEERVKSFAQTFVEILD